MISNTILVVDDNKINRKIICKILSTDYNVIEAENGKQAYNILLENKDKLIAITLDLIMPEMDGYEFLNLISSKQEFSNIPIIVTTIINDTENEIKVLELGAWDFVTKPYSPQILKFRLKNAISRSELSSFDKLKHLVEYDTLTGIYKRNKFYTETSALLKKYPEKDFAIIRFDIERFQLINSFFGTTEGDKLLIYIAQYIKKYCENKTVVTYGRIEADIFALCVDIDECNLLNDMEDIKTALKNYDLMYDIVPAFGVFIIEDKTLPISLMYDKASLAVKQCKGNYMKNYAFYSHELSDKIVKDQEIINRMNFSLKNNEFTIYFQPKFSLEKNKFDGAESLIRWIHPQKGLIPPSEFIPVFEKNGFITLVDYYVWEKTCQFLRKRINENKVIQPISVNVSRLNLYNPHFIESLNELTKKYNIPKNLLNLELTESVYIDNPNLMIETTEDLQKNGFIISMDDFGSGYSSLNLLKDINVNILKIDIKFFSHTKSPERGENIIASIVKMAKSLNIPVVAEGIETEKQVEFLKSIDCEAAQGYFFSKPITAQEYEKLLDCNLNID